ncbi:hypothetical protein [Chryseobacterium jejuense]|uniref:Peptidase S74 domain-containing protein n=1 Tax=Chryseobacterium jejuense TaxID=445960 RepID=A0A2X2VY77_CHRJE|nr:hypothetical protein [Chryseobacterium jejuense]SDJ21348.1 hypothetical protein SAMN05421542_3041 [Chryseobacterium jejuense]SQB28565.1 Uncharacterised protein [Chryseobacterium jejuense]
MAKKTIAALKEYFKAGKRPTESQFGDFIDSYANLEDKTIFPDNYKHKYLYVEFPHQQGDLAVDVLLGNNYLNGSLEIEITGTFMHQTSVGIIKKQFEIGLNPNGGVWYPTTSRIVEAAGTILDNIYIGDIVWDSARNEYKFTIYHTDTNRNPYALRIKQFSYDKAFVDQARLSDIYVKPLAGQRKHSVYYNGSVGIGTDNPQEKLDVRGAITSKVNSSEGGSVVLQNPNKTAPNNAQRWTIYNMTDGYGDGLQFWSYSADGNNYGSRMIITDTGNVGIGTIGPQAKLDVAGGINIAAGFPIQLGGNDLAHGLKYKRFNSDNSLLDGPFLYGWTGGALGVKKGDVEFNVLSWKESGNVAVQGKLEAKEFLVSATPTADHVFASDYNLRGINDLEKFITEKKHLPEIPSAKEMTDNGLSLGDFQIKLLQKIEELTLYAISQNKEIENLKAIIKK